MSKVIQIFSVCALMCGCVHSSEGVRDKTRGAEKKKRFPATRMNPKKPVNLSRLANSHNLMKSRFYLGGVYGKREASTVFLITAKDLGETYKLYWKQVAILSDKYACFMQKKWTGENATVFFCRDGRRVAFWTHEGRDWYRLIGRQYDRQGKQIIIAH